MGKQRMITGILVEAAKASVVEISDELESYYKLLDCSLIEFTERKILTGKPTEDKDEKNFNIVCDEEGLLKPDPKISAIDIYGNPELVGKLFITGLAKNGNLTSLSKEEQDRVLRGCRKFYTRFHPEGLMMLTLKSSEEMD
jgi:hypothetical protein